MNQNLIKPIFLKLLVYIQIPDNEIILFVTFNLKGNFNI